MFSPALAASRARMLPLPRRSATSALNPAQSFWTSDGRLVSAAAAAAALRLGTALLVGGLVVGTISEDE